jgi:signal transduction histidine kinase
VHLVFMVALGVLGLHMVKTAFEDYEEAWDKQVDTLAAEKLFTPLANEVARSLLLELEQGQPEQQEQIRRTVGEGLDEILPAIPSVDRLEIFGPEGQSQYSTGLEIGTTLVASDLVPLPGWKVPLRREIQLRSGDAGVEVVFPVFGDPEMSAASSERPYLGTVLIQYRPDPALEARLARLVGEPTSIEQMISPWAGQIAQSLLQELAKDEDAARQELQVSISSGLNKLIGSLPMEALVIVDQENRIQYINDPQYLDLIYTDAERIALFSSNIPERRLIDLQSGGRGVEIMLPVFDHAGDQDPQAAGRRLGSVLVHYRPDPELKERLPSLSPPKVGPWTYLQRLILFFALAVGGGILLAALTGVPVRRVERALADYQARGFKGGLDPKAVGVPADLASTVQAISELGGRLEALDAQGRDREAMLKTLSQTLEDGMVAVDPTGEPVAWNPAALRLLAGGGEEREPADGDETSEAAILKQALERNADLNLTINRADIGNRELEIVYPDGSSAVTRVTQVPVALGPDLTGTLLLLRDLAALRKVEEHLLDAGRFAVLAHLAASLAHEIRNPLHAIQLNASVVQQYAGQLPAGDKSKAVSESLHVIKTEAARLSELLNNYLGMVRPSDDASPVDLRDLSRRVFQLVDFVARKSRVEIRLEGEESPPMVYGVANRLQQAILNLVLNAIQAMPEGGTVTLRVDSYAEMVRLAVSDTGPGLPQELADQLFDTRVTTKEEGSGLGLPLVRLIAESHGGGVWYRSKPGEGASFMMVLPAI